MRVKRIVRRCLWRMVLPACLLVLPLPGRLEAAEAVPSRFVVENKFLSYSVQLRDRQDAEVTIVNKTLSQKHVLSSPLFMVMTEDRLADIARSEVHAVRTTGNSEEQQTAQIVTTCPRAGLSISVTYELAPGEFFLRKTLGISRLAAGQGVVTRIDVDVVHVPDAEEVQEFSGLGQPLYYRDLFFGVEYPACTLLHDGRGRIRVGYEYGLPVGLSAISSHTAVIGVAPDGDVSDSFLKYVDTIRTRPPQPFVLWNSWYDLRDFDEKACLESVRLLREKLCAPYGVRLDSIVLDDGWDDHRSLWRVARSRFPSEFKKIQEESSSIARGMGFWLSPWGDTARPERKESSTGRLRGSSSSNLPDSGTRDSAWRRLDTKGASKNVPSDFSVSMPPTTSSLMASRASARARRTGTAWDDTLRWL